MESDDTNRSPAIQPDAVLSGDLAELADTANTEHRQFIESAKSMVEHAIKAGEALLEAKAELGHGGWLRWLEENFEATERTARRYIQVASNRTRVSDLEEPSLRKALAAISGGNAGAHVGANTGENEWYTPPEIIDAAVQAMGAIDLDPASSRAANDVVQAERFYSESDDGLEQEWLGRVWMNPPYAQPWVERFVVKLLDEYKREHVEAACVLVNNASDTQWFTKLSLVANARCDIVRRVRFWHPDRGTGSPLQGQVIWYFGGDPLSFKSGFRNIGVVSLWSGEYAGV